MNTESLTLGIQVPGEGIARVIGKAGAGLKQIRESTLCRIQVSEQTDSSTLRRVSLTGSPQGLSAALQQVLLKAHQDDVSNIAVTVMIPADSAGQVVGKAGANLKRVRESFNIRIQMERDPVVDPQHGSERALTMSGNAMSMGQALCMALTGLASPLLPSQMPTSMQLGAGIAASGSSVVNPGDVRQASSDPEELQLHMDAPSRLVGAILGKEGQTIKQTGSTSGCKISVTKKDSNGERRIVIIGKYPHCKAAHSALQEQLEAAAESSATGEDVSTTRITYFVRGSAAGAVIGKGGNTLRQVREQTGTKIQLDRDEIQGQRPCTISGESLQVIEAIGLLYEIIRQDSPDGDIVDLAGAKRTANTTVMVATGNGLKRQRVEGEAATTKLLVPARCAGAVIGKSGSGLARIRESCGVKIEMLQQAQAPQFPEDRLVLLVGAYDCRESAITAVLQAAFQMDSTNTALKMLIPKSEAGAVIGKQGATLKMIREQSGLTVHMEKQDILGDRLVSASGPLERIVSVARWVMYSIEGRELQESAEGYTDVDTHVAPTAKISHSAAHTYTGAAMQGGYNWHGL